MVMLVWYLVSDLLKQEVKLAMVLWEWQVEMEWERLSVSLLVKEDFMVVLE
jgi:hypothetical protein